MTRMQQRNVTTIDPMVQDLPPSEGTKRRRRPVWRIALLIFVVVSVTAYLLGQRYTSHLYALAPGTAPSVTQYIAIKSPGQVRDHHGRILLVTVALRKE